MWDLTQPRSPYELPLADHPQRQGSHQQSRCPLSSFSRRSWCSPGSHSTAGRAPLTCWSHQVVGRTTQVKLNFDLEFNFLFLLGKCDYFWAISNWPIMRWPILKWDRLNSDDWASRSMMSRYVFVFHNCTALNASFLFIDKGQSIFDPSSIVIVQCPCCPRWSWQPLFPQS